MMNPEDLKYHKEHQWVRVEGNGAIVGITDHAQDALGDIVYMEVPEIGRKIKADQEICEIESTKTTAAIFAPMSGTITRVNDKIKDHPEIVNQDPYGEGWILEIEMAVPSEISNLMTAAQYDEMVRSESH
jgi:glycine cleavage system H protein